MTITELQPHPLWKNFEQLNRIPRPSKKEKRVTRFIKEFGERLDLETLVDETGNVLIRKPACKGMENRKGVVLQAHLDMVHQKNQDKKFDFEKEPIESLLEGEWVTANGTTLGADNGIGVAAMMTVLASDDIPHGPLEALFTVDEETGMTGAADLRPGWLRGDILLNLDGEDEGELFISCAGGKDTVVHMPYKKESPGDNMVTFELLVKGLQGGHSGIDIILERGNANKILARVLWKAARDFGLRVVSIDGGGLRNAIPREAKATVLIPVDKQNAFSHFIEVLKNTLLNELGSRDPGLKIELSRAEAQEEVMVIEDQNRLLNALIACPDGVTRRSAEVEDLVETSTNLARVVFDNGQVKIESLQRSTLDSSKEALSDSIRGLFELAGVKVVDAGSYPGWKPQPDSSILKTMKKVYNKRFGKLPEVRAIHAGLECGIIGSKYPDLEMISFGPTIVSPHSPDEKVQIETVQKFWDLLRDTLNEIPGKS